MDLRQGALDAAVATGAVPFVAALTARASGVDWEGGAGPAAENLSAGPHVVLRLFSMTKAVAGLAAAMLADRGRLDLDAPVARYLPEFDRIRVLDGWDGETPQLRAPRRSATVRDLATHTAGFAYSHWDADMRRYRTASGLPPMASGAKAALFYPLAGDPGTSWRYGIGIDWLGLVIEAADGRPIDAFCRAEILAPLGMDSTSFVLDGPLSARLAGAFARATDGGFVPVEIAPPTSPEFIGMGDALYGTPSDYIRLLRLFLGRGALDGVRLLSETAAAAMLANQIGALRAGPMRSTNPRVSADVDLLPGAPLSHSLIGLRAEADVPGMRRAGAQGWAGILNTHWWIDPAADRAAVWATQALPFLDPPIAAAYAAFERAVYA